MKMNMLSKKNDSRRRFFGPSVLAFALMQSGALGAANAQAATPEPVVASAGTLKADSFGPLKHINALSLIHI